jgi:hypothetical protein
VARIAVRYSVRADQGKTVLVFIDGMNGNLPAGDAVTEVALRSVFAPVDIGVTVLAIASHVGENWIRVAFLAGHVGMQAAQRKAGLAMIEVGLRENWPPRGNGVTFLTGNFELTMRAFGISARWDGRLGR